MIEGQSRSIEHGSSKSQWMRNRASLNWMMCATAREWQNSNLGTTPTAVRNTILLFTIHIFPLLIYLEVIYIYLKSNQEIRNIYTISNIKFHIASSYLTKFQKRCITEELNSSVIFHLTQAVQRLISNWMNYGLMLYNWSLLCN